MSATTTQLLSSGEFWKPRYDTIPVKSASANVYFYTNKSKSAKFWVMTLLSQMSDISSVITEIFWPPPPTNLAEFPGGIFLNPPSKYGNSALKQITTAPFRQSIQRNI